MKIPCNFWNLQVNTDNVFINLELESINDPAFLLDVDAALEGLNHLADNLNILFEDQPIDTFNIEGVIDYMYVNEENEVIAVEVNDDGTIEERKIGDEKDLEKILLKDEEGREYVVTKKGDVMGAKEYADTDGGKKGEVSDRKDKIEDEAAETPSVAFTAFEKQEYGFDEYTEVKASIQNQYPVLKGDYRPAFKSIAGYSPDAVAISGYNQHTLFKDDMGIPATRQGNKLILLGGPHESEKTLYAFDTLAKPEQVIGKLNLKSYTPETFKLVMVSVNGATLPNATELSNTLNAIYKQGVVKWEVEKGSDLTNISFEGDKMSHGGSGITTPYNNDQKTLINTYDDTYELQDEARYLFFVSEVVDRSANIAGYMPLKYQCGFIYGLPNNNTIAHELGHGTFNLYHTFSTENNISPEGTTQNLMDYAGGTELWHYQWDLIHDPESMWLAALQDESEGQAMVSIPDLLKTIRQGNIDGNRVIEITQNECPENAYREVPVGNAKLRYFAIHCSDDFETIPLEPQTTSFTEWKLPEKGNQILIIPGSKNTVEFETTLGWAKRYQFFEAKDMPPPLDYTESDNLLFSFIILREDAAIFEDYLYPTWEKLMDKEELTAAEISIVRQGIEKVADETKKGDYYQELQTKVKYRNQRDNKPTVDLHENGQQATADRMYNVTSLAMAFEMLGVSKEDFINKAEDDNITIPQDVKDGDFEDILDFIRIQKDYANRTTASSWDSLASYGGMQSEMRSVYSSKNNNSETTYLNNCLRSGKGVVMSIAYQKGHITRLQTIDNSGVTIDDPYGQINSLAKREFNGLTSSSGSYDPNTTDMSLTGKKGEDCSITWSEFDVSVLSGNGGNEEMNGGTALTSTVTFYDWLSAKSNFAEYSIRQETVNQQIEGNMVPVTITYYLTKGATIKYYKVYSKPTSNEN